jgi:cell wall-associated NlpC family hydrolase
VVHSPYVPPEAIKPFQPPRRWWRPLLLGAAVAAVLAPATAAHADPSLDQVEKQISADSNRLEKVVEQFNKVNEELKASQAQAQALQAELAPLTLRLSTASRQIDDIAALSYKGAGLAALSSMFGEGDPAAVVDRLTTLNQVTKYEHAQIVAVTELKARHDVEVAKLDGLIADQTAKRKALDDQRGAINADLAKLYELRRKAYGSRTTTVTASTATPPNVSGNAGVAVRFAYAQLGKPYEWAADGPGSYDCSGLTMAAWRAAGKSLPHNAEMQWNKLPHLSRAGLQPGDLVFYNSLNHVGLYVGSGQIIHAPTFGDHVRLASIDVMRPYGYARVR